MQALSVLEELVMADEARRRPLDLNPLTTNIASGHAQYTPSSAYSTLSTSFDYSSSNYTSSSYTTPISSVRQYNPQHFTASPSGASDASTYSTSRPADLDEVNPAPPPYSPRTQRIRTPSEEHYAAARGSSGLPSRIRASPEVGTRTVFPPPPSTNHRSRHGSDRSLHLFGLSNVLRRTGGDNPRSDSKPTGATTNGRPDALRTSSEHHEEALLQASLQAPSSRRSNSTPTSSHGSASSPWDLGMALPPPPPVPPAQGARAQSLGRASDVVIPPPPRRHPFSNPLGSVPRSPATWVDSDASRSRDRSPERDCTRELNLDTSSASSTSAASGPVNVTRSSSSLTRTYAVRGDSKSIRERRSDSRTSRQCESQPEQSVSADVASSETTAEVLRPSNITVPAASGLQRRATITKSTPKSESLMSDTPKSAQNPPSGQSLNSRGSTPRPTSNAVEQPTSQSSPSTCKGALNSAPLQQPSRSFQTPPLQSRSSVGSPRPVSHILHMPNDDPINVAPLVSSIPSSAIDSNSASSAQNVKTMSSSFPSDQFAQAAIQRHLQFARREAAASSDGDRVKIFAEFIVAESRLRRDRYSAAIDIMGSEILDLTRDLFRPRKNNRRGSSASCSSMPTPESSAEPRSHRGSLMGAILDDHQVQASSEPALNSGPASPAMTRPDMHWNEYKPSLSPIPSMSVSEALEGSESRGRPSSRWWEASEEGSNGATSGRLARSKRESKYMGVPKELREALQYVDEGNEGDMKRERRMTYGPNEYPPEKTGAFAERAESPNFAASFRLPAQASPSSLSPGHLDVSRLITLPPPYPRHYPAVNNNHPDLALIRNRVRQSSDLSEIQTTKRRFLETMEKMRGEREIAAVKRRKSILANIQYEVAIGNLTYAEAAALEASHETSEKESSKETISQEFDHFQVSVMHPLNEILNDRIKQCSHLFDQLRSKLLVDAQHQSPNAPQEEGDEQPELLEQLTLLKWIFEARETLHREVYDLLTDRNARYAEKAIAPYQVANNAAKISHARKFFASDDKKRQKEFHSSILRRTQDFLSVIEQNVVRGVEVQLSAFWDIAPSLSDLIAKIPKIKEGLRSCQIRIPQKEYEENPAYWNHPLMYVYTLLDHCGRASWQFMESQVNLLCLLHEIKGAAARAKFKVEGLERRDGPDVENPTAGMDWSEKQEEERLTRDLKEKVRVVEELWAKGLGEEMEGGKRRIRTFLESVGGWDEDVLGSE